MAMLRRGQQQEIDPEAAINPEEAKKWHAGQSKLASADLAGDLELEEGEQVSWENFVDLAMEIAGARFNEELIDLWESMGQEVAVVAAVAEEVAEEVPAPVEDQDEIFLKFDDRSTDGDESPAPESSDEEGDDSPAPTSSSNAFMPPTRAAGTGRRTW